MPRRSRAAYRTMLGPQAPPEWVGDERGGYVQTTLNKLATEGGQQLGIQPQGKGAWRVAEEGREPLSSARGKTEGLSGTLTPDTYGFNTPQERPWQTLQMAGPRAILACHLNKRRRDLVTSGSALPAAQCCRENRTAMRARRDIQENLAWTRGVESGKDSLFTPETILRHALSTTAHAGSQKGRRSPLRPCGGSHSKRHVPSPCQTWRLVTNVSCKR